MAKRAGPFSLVGIEAVPVEAEVDISPGALPKNILVGLPEAAVKRMRGETIARIARTVGLSRPTIYRLLAK